MGARGVRGHVVVVALATLIAVGFVVKLLSVTGALALGGSYELKATLPTAVSLTSGARVTMAGVEVGRVKAVKREGVVAIAVLSVTDDRVTPIPADTRATVRLHTAVGENYVALTPGTSDRTLSSGGSLPLRQAEDYVDLDQILSTLQGPTRQRARDLFINFGKGLDGRGERLNTLLARLAGTYRPGARVVDVLAERREEIARLVDNVGRLGRGLADRRAAIGSVARGTRETFMAIADRDEALRASLRELPATLSAARSSSGALRRATRDVTPTLVELTGTLAALRPGIRALPSAAQEGRALIADIAGATPALRRTLRRVRRLAPSAPSALRRTRDTLCQLNPIVAHLSPYAKDVVAMMTSFGSSINAYDSLGHIIRVTPVVGDNSLVGAPEPISRALQQLLNDGVFQETGGGLGYNPYPDPDRAGEPDGLGALGPEEVSKKYPRIRAAC